MNLRHYARVTVDGEATHVTVKRCEGCSAGTLVYLPVGFRSRAVLLGHIKMGVRHGPTALVSARCPGDVSISAAHGVVRRGAYRTQVFMRSLRTLVWVNA
jgi:hypothetical protein